MQANDFVLARAGLNVDVQRQCLTVPGIPVAQISSTGSLAAATVAIQAS